MDRLALLVLAASAIVAVWLATRPRPPAARPDDKILRVDLRRRG
jgi:hypothetical protein